MQLIIGNKRYSSWSLRPWMLMTALGIPFEETVIPLYQPDTAERIRKYSPAGRVPVLIDGDVAVWESLAILEYLHDKYPDRGVWPKDSAARAYARAIASEMHAGFQPLRQACPMNLTKRFKPKDHGADVEANVARICAIWSDARRRFGDAGPFLFGAFAAADAMYAPVVTRFDTYQLPVDDNTRTYMAAVLGHPAFVAWRTSALSEPWMLPHYEEGHEVAETYVPTQR
jgi:glutathione S-transferase